MSFILDALRKSERERQQQASPGIGDAAQRPPRRTTNRWLMVTVAILAVNAVLVAALLLRSNDEQPTAGRQQQPASLPETPPAPARRPALTAGQREDVRPLAEVVPQDDVSPSPPEAAMARQSRAAAKPPPEPAPAPTPPPRPSASAGVPTMEEVVLEGQLEMSPLRLDIHVFSERADQRFVFINMSKYREGESTKEGPRVIAITPDGVVLSHQGTRFLLTR